jgi:hypothetical protein
LSISFEASSVAKVALTTPFRTTPDLLLVILAHALIAPLSAWLTVKLTGRGCAGVTAAAVAS